MLDPQIINQLLQWIMSLFGSRRIWRNFSYSIYILHDRLIVKSDFEINPDELYDHDWSEYDKQLRFTAYSRRQGQSPTQLYGFLSCFNSLKHI